MKRRALISVVVLAALTIGYIAGYKAGPARERQLSETKFRIMTGKRLYQDLAAGETNRAISTIRFVLWNDTTAYERTFGVPDETDSFARHFAEAKAITINVEPQLQTNAQKFQRDLNALLATNNISIKKHEQ